MPGNLDGPYSSSWPSESPTSPPLRDPRNQVSSDEWSTQNSRAKAIIMSTLMPGSEAWKIAEALEYASDIWTALEQVYGPSGGTNNILQPGAPSPRAESKRIVEVAPNLEHKDSSVDCGQPRPLVSRMASESRLRKVDSQVRSQARPPQDGLALESGGDQERRDKRLLWALLNGGKDELDTATIQTGQQLCAL